MNKLRQEAINARDNAYAPYSKFLVGAAILLKDNTIIKGCNVENVAYGSTICAERSAIVSLISQGYKKEDIKEFLIISDTKDPIIPCGACLQVMQEIFNDDVIIHLHTIKEKNITTNIKNLLPYQFKELK